MTEAATACVRRAAGASGVTVATALRRFVPVYREACRPTPHQVRVLDWLCACQTPALGGHLARCACGWSRPVYNSCADRHCPTCRGGARATWLTERQAQLLEVPHFQVVFTLPGVLRPVARCNPARVYDLLFRAAADTLAELAKDRLDAQLGVLAVLHTWRNDLGYHPHVHCLVTAGGLRTEPPAWVATRPEFLFPTRVMAALVRGKLIAGLQAARDELVVPDGLDLDGLLRAAWRHAWVVHVEPPQGRPTDQVVKYLARYVAGTAISDARMVAVGATAVSFRTRHGVQTVSGVEFVRRFAQHILPRRFRRVRYYGLYAPGNARTRLVQARQVRQDPVPAKVSAAVPARTCPVCGGLLVDVALPHVRGSRPGAPPRARGPP